MGQGSLTAHANKLNHVLVQVWSFTSEDRAGWVVRAGRVLLGFKWRLSYSGTVANCFIHIDMASRWPFCAVGIPFQVRSAHISGKQHTHACSHTRTRKRTHIHPQTHTHPLSTQHIPWCTPRTAAWRGSRTSQT